MLTKEKAGSTATEIISDLYKQVNKITADLEYLYDGIKQINAMFSAIHYATTEGGINEDDANLCMSGISKMLNILKDNAEEFYFNSDAFVTGRER